MSANEFVINFDNVSKAEATKYTTELREQLLDIVSSDISVEVERDAEDTQDFGSTLVLILGTPAVIAIATGIQIWLSRRPTARITIKKREPNGKAMEVIVDGVTSSDAAKIADALRETI